MNNNIRNARARAGMTQEDVARAAQVPVRMYQGYEYAEREPRASTAIRVARALSCKVEDLFC